MMLSASTFVQSKLKNKTVKELEEEKNHLKEEIAEFEKIRDKNYMHPSPAVIISMYNEYIDEIERKIEWKNKLSNLSEAKIMIGLKEYIFNRENIDIYKFKLLIDNVLETLYDWKNSFSETNSNKETWKIELSFFDEEKSIFKGADKYPFSWNDFINDFNKFIEHLNDEENDLISDLEFEGLFLEDDKYNTILNNKSPEEKYDIAYSYLYGKGVEKDLKKSFEIFKELIEKDDYKKAYGFMGDFYYRGKVIEQDYNRAMYYYTEAIKYNEEDKSSNYFLGEMFYKGKGVKINLEKAKYYFEKAIKENDDKALYRLGKIEKEQNKDIFNKYFDKIEIDLCIMLMHYVIATVQLEQQNIGEILKLLNYNFMSIESKILEYPFNHPCKNYFQKIRVLSNDEYDEIKENLKKKIQKIINNPKIFNCFDMIESKEAVEKCAKIIVESYKNKINDKYENNIARIIENNIVENEERFTDFTDLKIIDDEHPIREYVCGLKFEIEYKNGKKQQVKLYDYEEKANFIFDGKAKVEYICKDEVILSFENYVDFENVEHRGNNNEFIVLNVGQFIKGKTKQEDTDICSYKIKLMYIRKRKLI